MDDGVLPMEVHVKRLDGHVPSGKPSKPDCFIGECVNLRPATCALACAGKHPTRMGVAASGAWRGSLVGDCAISAATCLASLLAGTVLLDGCGTFADAGLSSSSLQFRRVASGEDEEETGQAETVLGGPATALRLAGKLGQILTHRGRLWLRQKGSEFDALFILQPLQRVSTAGATSFRIARPSPMGIIEQRWQEVALIELPRLLRLTMDASADRRKAAALAKLEPNFLVDEEEEMLKIHCWHRVESAASSGAALEAISLEQLLWYTTVAALAETTPCAEAAVPMQRIVLSDEGVATREEILGEVAQHDVPKEDAPRLGSLGFLRQFVSNEIILEEVLPRLLPAHGVVRVLSAELASNSRGGGPSIRAQAALGPGPLGSHNKPKSLDDLFSDDVDFRKPWAGASDEDPLMQHELTSVLLLNESNGFVLAFHCLQGVDPLAS